MREATSVVSFNKGRSHIIVNCNNYLVVHNGLVCSLISSQVMEILKKLPNDPAVILVQYEELEIILKGVNDDRN